MKLTKGAIEQTIDEHGLEAVASAEGDITIILGTGVAYVRKDGVTTKYVNGEVANEH